jgi:hypothetical protein
MIKIVDHAKERMSARGATVKEIKEVINHGNEIPAKHGRKAKEKVFEYGKQWLGKVYPQKKVVVIYVEEDDKVVVITVKVFYGTWRKG